MSETDIGWVEVYRANHGFFDRRTPATLTIDGVPRGSVMPYEYLEVEVHAGLHKVRGQCDDDVSNELELSILPKHQTHVTLTSRPGSAWFNPLLLGKVIRLRLRQEPQKVG